MSRTTRSIALLAIVCLTGVDPCAAQVLAYEVDGQNGEYLGWSVALVGEVDGDGIDDFAAGAVFSAGRVLLYSGANGA